MSENYYGFIKKLSMYETHKQFVLYLHNPIYIMKGNLTNKTYKNVKQNIDFDVTTQY